MFFDKENNFEPYEKLGETSKDGHKSLIFIY